jgi:predicted ATPase
VQREVAALQVAANLVEEFADGGRLVKSAALSDPSLVPQTAASALGVREEPGRLLEAMLTDYVRARSLPFGRVWLVPEIPGSIAW